MSTYHRVVPRDLFNESKLLKCLGQLSLIIHDGLDGARYRVPDSLKLEHDTTLLDNGFAADSFQAHRRFVVEQHAHSGDIYCANVLLFYNGQRVEIYSAMNSKKPYPLIFETESAAEFMFDDSGEFSGEFREFLESN